MTTAKQRIFFFGNCQGGWLAGALSQNPAIAERFEIIYLSDYVERPADHPIHQPGFLSTCSYAIWQTAYGCQPPDFVGGLPASCRQIRYPTLWLKLLWPTYAVDPRNKPEPGLPWGRFPNGDRLAMKLLEAGVSLEDLPKRYIDFDLNQLVNLERFSEMSLAELRYNDQQSDIAIAPFIESTFRRRKLFGTVNHPTYLVLNRLYHGLVAALLDTPVPAEPPPPENAADIVGAEETPLHPQIMDHFRLEWAWPDMKWHFRSAFLNLTEYIRAYAAFEPIPFGDSPNLWLARAQQAIDRKDLGDARRLLLEGASKYPDMVQFLQYLGLLLLQHGELLEAEKVYRYAISRHPDVAALHSKLGVVLLRRQFRPQALLSFEEALRIDPQHREARQYLSQAASPAR